MLDAYAGGGRRVARVEVSFDGGVDWVLAQVTYPEVNLFPFRCLQAHF